MAPRRWTLALIGGVGMILVALAIAGLAGLMMGEPGSRGYVEREATGQLAIGYRNCPGESIKDLAVYDMAASTPVLLRKVSRVAEVQVTRIVLGQVPNGFSESAAFAEPVVTNTIRFRDQRHDRSRVDDPIRTLEARVRPVLGNG